MRDAADAVGRGSRRGIAVLYRLHRVAAAAREDRRRRALRDRGGGARLLRHLPERANRGRLQQCLCRQRSLTDPTGGPTATTIAQAAPLAAGGFVQRDIALWTAGDAWCQGGASPSTWVPVAAEPNEPAATS